jgi:hypothetical protein
MVFNVRSVAFRVLETEGRSDAVATIKVRVYNIRFKRLRGCVPAGFLEHVRRLRNAEYCCLDKRNCACFRSSQFLEVGRERVADLPLAVFGFLGIASSSTTISISVLDTQPSSAATEFLDRLLLEERRRGLLKWSHGNWVGRVCKVRSW